MTNEEKKAKSIEDKKIEDAIALEEKEKAEEKRLADEKAKQEKSDAEEKEKAEEKRLADEKAAEEKAKNNKDTYIMKVSTLRWGAGNKKFFIGYQRPVISRKVMGEYHKTIDLWLKKKWIEKGSYPENKKK